MARFMVKASEFKNVCKAVNDRKLAELKKEIIEILKKQDENEVKKAVDYFTSQELHYTHLEKSLVSGKWIEKAGYGVGTVRIWKGKKYKKIAPGKWARVFDKESKGANVAIGRLIAEVERKKSVEELMDFVMAHKQRFVDDNGIDLPILDKLRAAADVKNEKLSGESSPYVYGVGENVNAAKNEMFSKKDKIKKEEADLHKVSRKISQVPTAELKQEKARLERAVANKTRNKRDSLNNAIFRESNQQKLDAINKELEKRNNGTADKKTESSKKIEVELLSKEEMKKMTGDKLADYRHKLHEEMKKFDYGDDDNFEKVYEVKKIADDIFRNKEFARNEEPEEESKTYWIQDPRGNRLTNEDAKEKIKGQMAYLAELEDMAGKKMNNRTANDIRYYIDYLKDRLNPEDRKEIESEAEKHQNRSDAMKGNQNAKKYGLTDEQIERYDIQEVVEDVSGYGIVKNSEGKYSYIDDGRVKDRPDDFETSIEKVKERINDTYETKKNIDAAKNYDFENAKLGSDIKYTKRSDGKHMYFKKSPDGSKALSVTVEVSDMREPLNMTYEVSDTKSGESWQYETAYGNKEGLEWAVERPEQMEKELKKFFKRDPEKEWNKQNTTDSITNFESEGKVVSYDELKPIATNKSVGENEVQMPYSKDIVAEIEALKKCAYELPDRSREFMRHVYYVDGNLVATDGRRMKVVKVGELDGISDGSYVDITTNKSGINIKKKEVEGNFPNYKKVIPDNLNQTATLDTKLVKEKIKEMRKDGAIDKKGVNLVQLEFRDGKVFIDDTPVGNAKDIALKFSKNWGETTDDTNFVDFNADYLENALTGKTAVLQMGDRADKAMAINTGSTSNIVMPMSGNGEKRDYSGNREIKDAENKAKDKKKADNRKYNESKIKEYTPKNVNINIDDMKNRMKEMSDEELKRNYDMLTFNLDKVMDKKMFTTGSAKVDSKLGLDLAHAVAYKAIVEKYPEVKDIVSSELESRGISVKKSLFDDFIMDVFAADDEEELEEGLYAGETEYNDYSAEQPELFNSTAMKVREAMDRIRNQVL